MLFSMYPRAPVFSVRCTSISPSNVVSTMTRASGNLPTGWRSYVEAAEIRQTKVHQVVTSGLRERKASIPSLPFEAGSG